MAIPAMPATHTWVQLGPGLSNASGGHVALLAADTTEVWVWDEDTDTAITDLIDADGNPTTTVPVKDGWAGTGNPPGVGIPVAVKVVSFSTSQGGKRMATLPVQTLRDAAAAIAPTDSQVASLIPNTSSQTRIALGDVMGGDPVDLVPAVAGKADRAVGLVVAPAGTAAANRTTVQDALTSAATFGAPVLLKGAFSIDGTITVPDKARIEAHEATVTQTANLTPVFTVADRSAFNLAGGTFIGKTSDYVDDPNDNTGSMYAAALVRATSTSSVRISDVKAFGFGGPLLYGSSVTEVWIDRCKVVGVGAGGGYGTVTWQAGLSKNNAAVILDGPSTRAWISDSDISYTAQGILGGKNTEIHIDGLKVHDIGGQHGIYLNNTVGLHISRIRGWNIAANLVKLQLSTEGNGDATDIIISDISGYNITGSVLHMTASPTSGKDKFRRVIAHDIIGFNVGDGVLFQGISGYDLHDVMIWGASAAGVRLDDCTNGDYARIHTRDTMYEGVRVSGNVLTTPTVASRNRGSQITIEQPALAAGPTTQFGWSSFNSEYNTVDGLTIRDANLLANVSTVWATATAYKIGDRVKTSTSKVLECTAAGTSGSTEPAPTTANATVTDGTVTWVYRVAAMRYGVYIGSAAGAGQSSMRFRNVRASDATDYGARVLAAAVGEWTNNAVSGSLGEFHTAPTSGEGNLGRQYFGSGSPEGVVTARVGSMYFNTAGGASTTLYVKTSGTGNTGWTAK